MIPSISSVSSAVAKCMSSYPIGKVTYVFPFVVQSPKTLVSLAPDVDQTTSNPVKCYDPEATQLFKLVILAKASSIIALLES